MPAPRRSPCPVACTLDLIGDRWTLLVIRDLACGKTRFKELAASPERIASNILSARLRLLVEHGLAEKQAASDATGQPGYRLTPRGESLLPVMQRIANWGLKHLAGTRAYLTPKLPRRKPAQGQR